MPKCTTDVMPTYWGLFHFQTMHCDRILFLSDETGEPNPLIHSFVSFITCLLLPSTVFLCFFHPLFFAFFLHPFLDAFVFSRKAPNCFFMCVRPSVCINSGPIGRIFVKLDTWKSDQETQVCLKSDKLYGTKSVFFKRSLLLWQFIQK
jgi:hypothetical protein